MKIDKFEASGNDFIIIEDFKQDEPLRKKISSHICNRHFGVGADGVVFINKIEDNKFIFRIWNNDGTEAEISGNGLINAGGYVARKYNKKTNDKTTFITKAGEKEVTIRKTKTPSVWLKVNMGKPEFSSEKIPFYDGKEYERIVDYPLNINKRVYNITVLSVGNPHTMLFFKSFPSSIELQQIGSEIESHPFFPNRTNVEFVKVIDKENIAVLFWERGVGETLSSGSGSAASVLASKIKGYTGNIVNVKTKAGNIKIELSKDSVFLNGCSNHVLSGKFFNNLEIS